MVVVCGDAVDSAGCLCSRGAMPVAVPAWCLMLQRFELFRWKFSKIILNFFET